MKIKIFCPECNEITGDLVILNDNLCKMVCKKGHTKTVLIGKEHHEILFEMGAQAIIDGYYREAITSFSASLERYYEFFVKVIYVNSDIDEIWKMISSQSERQLGAYIFTYYQFINEKPKLLPRKLIELRNRVVHKGYIATKEEAVDFGRAVSKIIINGGCILKKEYESRLINFKQERKRIASTKTSIDVVDCFHTFLNCMNNKEDYHYSFAYYIYLMNIFGK